MAKKISRVPYYNLRKQEQHSFHDRILRILQNTCGCCGKVFDRFEYHTEAFDKLIAEKASAPSLSLAELDAIADNAWSALNLQVKASLMHPRQSVKDAAEQVNAIFSKIPNPTHLNYDQEYGSLRTLLNNLAALSPETLKDALVDEHVHALEVAVEDFVSASSTKVDALSKKQASSIKAVTTDCFNAWKDLAKYLELMDSLNSLPGSSEAIDQINTIVDEIKRRIDLRKANKDNSEENIVEQTDEVP